jgi:hypothetical protein
MFLKLTVVSLLNLNIFNDLFKFEFKNDQISNILTLTYLFYFEIRISSISNGFFKNINVNAPELNFSPFSPPHFDPSLLKNAIWLYDTNISAHTR